MRHSVCAYRVICPVAILIRNLPGIMSRSLPDHCFKTTQLDIHPNFHPNYQLDLKKEINVTFFSDPSEHFLTGIIPLPKYNCQSLLPLSYKTNLCLYTFTLSFCRENQLAITNYLLIHAKTVLKFK